ncbi:MAG: hypothetical protein KY412_03320, partial [Actinobacteria bacterium]|nr:hypothetical protein [Actinomycetota bacterium]
MAILARFTATLFIGGRMVLDGGLEVGLHSVPVFMTQPAVAAHRPGRSICTSEEWPRLAAFSTA